MKVMKNPAKKLTLSITASLLVSALLLPSAFAADMPAGTVTSGGLTWTRNNSTASPYSTNWNNANSTCNNLIVGGADNWRLPTQKELSALYSVSKSALTKAGWTLVQTWSSNNIGTGFYYSVGLGDGDAHWYSDSNNFFVSCVQ